MYNAVKKIEDSYYEVKKERRRKQMLYDCAVRLQKNFRGRAVKVISYIDALKLE